MCHLLQNNSPHPDNAVKIVSLTSEACCMRPDNEPDFSGSGLIRPGSATISSGYRVLWCLKPYRTRWLRLHQGRYASVSREKVLLLASICENGQFCTLSCYCTRYESRRFVLPCGHTTRHQAAEREKIHPYALAVSYCAPFHLCIAAFKAVRSDPWHTKTDKPHYRPLLPQRT